VSSAAKTSRDEENNMAVGKIGTVLRESDLWYSALQLRGHALLYNLGALHS